MKGQALKVKGMDAALSNASSWAETMLEHLRAFCKVRKDLDMPQFRMEEFRAVALTAQWEAPPSHKAWGALATAAAKRGIIKSTDRYVKAQSPATHSHPVLLWQAA